MALTRPLATAQAAIDLLKPGGGKVHAFVASLPAVGVHALKPREATGLGEKDKLSYLVSQVGRGAVGEAEGRGGREEGRGGGERRRAQQGMEG